MIHTARAPRIWIPPRLARRIQRTCPAFGVPTMAVGVLVGVLMPVLGRLLPAATGAVTLLTTSTGIFLGLFLLVSGATMTMARGWVSVGHHQGGAGYLLNARAASFAVGPLGVAAGAAFLSSVFFFVSFSANLTWSSGPHSANVHAVTMGIFLYLLFPAITVVLTLTNLVIGLPLFRSSQRTIQRYAR
jgi:hypothetical protein